MSFIYLMLMLVVLWIFYVPSQALDSTTKCRNLLFLPPMEDVLLSGHVIKKEWVTSEGNCQVLCYMEERCASYNLGPFFNGFHACEISDSDNVLDNNDMMEEKGYIFCTVQNPCHSMPCFGNGSTCLVGFTEKGYQCKCGSGLSGEHCDDIDECAQKKHNCSAHAQCHNTQSSFNCSCDEGYQGDGVNCRDIDECTQQMHNCSVAAQCHNTQGSFNCSCDKGYQGDGVNCTATGHYHWKLDGSDSDVGLFSGAEYVMDGGRMVLHLSKVHSHAETPAVDIQQSSFSFACWIKITSHVKNQAIIYADWSYPHQFRFYARKNFGLCINLRRAGPYPQNEMVHYCAGFIRLHQWEHVAFTWDRENGLASTYINGQVVKQRVVTNVSPLVPSSHSVYDIGFKRDSNDCSNGFFRDLHLFKMAVSVETIEILYGE